MIWKVLAPAIGAVLFLATPHQAAAQTISFEEAYDRISQSCGADIRKYCAGVPLGGGAVKACLDAKQSVVSASCNATLSEVFTLIQKRMQAQASVRQICDADIARRCPGVVQHEGFVLSCMLKATRVVSAPCNQAITDAGWR
ncbi:hypothetical protein [Prosthecomicrobium sp. N25]|uniref:hypothetical protein n=1 Tax=Prosthecomicrobium sp. N25 TaxID=3129254 RepID=UPI00307881F9